MKILPLLLFALASFSSYCQNNPTEMARPIVAEGKLLYRSEMASWYGTDLFLERFKEMDKVGGYFSYSEADQSICVFFSSSEPVTVLGTISFDSTYNTATAKVDMSVREFTTVEQQLYEIRNAALEEMYVDTMFTTYSNTSFNLIPIIDGKEKKLYVLTGPAKSGVVLFGNDFLLTFDDNNKVLSKKRLHQNLIPVYLDDEQANGTVGSMHTHKGDTGDFMTATDICTIMLYQHYTNWETCTVVSEKYINMWNCKTNQLTVIEKDVFKKIDEDQKKRHGDDKEKDE